MSATSYQAEEALEVISVCVTISGASLARQVLVNVMTMANSAQGTHVGSAHQMFQINLIGISK